MLARCPLPFSINIAVAGIAGLKICIYTQADVQGLVRIVASGTAAERLSIEMRLVTLSAGRNMTML